MLDGVLKGWAPAWVFARAHAVVVAASVVGEVDSFQALRFPIMKLLCHIFIVDLVQDDIEFVDLG